MFFTTGPFAWNGLMSWWVPATDFFTFFLVMCYLTVKALKAEDSDARAEEPAPHVAASV